MFDRFNEPARRALFFARYESSRLGREVIDSEHLLLGILREGDPVTTELWRAFHVIPERIRAKYPTVEARVSASAALPISDDVKTILAYALEEASARDEVEVTPGHLVLGILRVPTCGAAMLLAEHGVEYDVISEVLRTLNEHAKRRAETDARTPLVLRQPHYEFLDRLAASMNLRGERHENRQRLTLAVMDALIASNVSEQKFETPEELKRQIHAALSKQRPSA